jgi:nucleotide-binding universal stress UspA family protein
MKTYLAAIELSSISPKVVEYAAQMATQTDSKLVILHVVELAPLREPGSDIVIHSMSMESPDLKGISAQLDQVAKPLRVRGLNVETVVRVGIPADEIMKQAKAIDAMMVILGSHGHHCINASLFNPSVDILRSLNLLDGISDNRVDLGLT